LIDKENILALGFTDIQGLIIGILTKRPAHSIKKDNLSTQILRYLGIDIRREARKKFESRVLKVVEILKEKGIIKEYKSKNVRLKLSNIHKDILFKEPEEDAASILTKEAIPDQDHEEGDFDTETGIPELPDEVSEDEIEDDNEIDKSSGEISAGGMADREMERLLGIFLGTNGAGAGPSGGNNLIKGKYSNLLQEIKEHYDKNANVQVELAPHKLALRVRTSSGHIVVLINLDEAREEMAVKSLIPHLENANLEILRLFSTCNYVGSLSVEESQGQFYFSVKDTVLISRADCAEIIKRIDQIILESINIDEIIDKYL
jgi:hypothetical protein